MERELRKWALQIPIVRKYRKKGYLIRQVSMDKVLMEKLVGRVQKRRIIKLREEERDYLSQVLYDLVWGYEPPKWE